MPTLKEHFMLRGISREEWDNLSNQEKEEVIDFQGLKEWLRRQDKVESERFQKSGVIIYRRDNEASALWQGRGSAAFLREWGLVAFGRMMDQVDILHEYYRI